MRVLIIGGHGTIGKRLVAHFETKYEIIIAGRSKGDTHVDITEIESIQALFWVIGKVDAVICAAGEAKWDDFEKLTEDDYYIGIRSKLMGQVNLVSIGKDFINPGGSITLSTGILADDPVVKTASAAMVNGAIHSFVKAVNLEMENDVRVNAVSLGLVEDAYKKYESYFPGHIPITMEQAVNGYVRSVEGRGRGEVIRVY